MFAATVFRYYLIDSSTSEAYLDQIALNHFVCCMYN